MSFDFKPGCKFKFVHCLETYLKIDQCGPISDPAGAFLTNGALKLASQGLIRGTFWAP